MKNKIGNLAWGIFLFIGSMVMFSRTAKAYIDPSIITFAIQIGAGIVVAIGAVVGITWRKMKRKVAKKLGIEENARKEIEEDVVEITDGADIKPEKD